MNKQLPVAGAYLRCSTRKQDLQGQRRAVSQWAKAQGYALKLFEDDHVSGKRTDRAGIEALIAAAERGEFTLVAVTELSRIGRSIGFITATVDRLCKAGVRIVLVKSGSVLDYESLEGRALVNALALASDIEWCLIAERNQRGRETIKARGVKVGRKPKEVSPTILRALRDEGLSVRQIAAELGNVSPATVARRLKALKEGA